MFAHLPAYVAVLLILAELVVRTFGACLVSVFCAARFLCSPLGAAPLLVDMSLVCIAVTLYEFILYALILTVWIACICSSSCLLFVFVANLTLLVTALSFAFLSVHGYQGPLVLGACSLVGLWLFERGNQGPLVLDACSLVCLIVRAWLSRASRPWCTLTCLPLSVRACSFWPCIYLCCQFYPCIWPCLYCCC